MIDKQLHDAGYHLLGFDHEIDDLIISIIDTSNNRYLKAIPFLIYKYDFDSEYIRTKIKSKRLLSVMLKITKYIFQQCSKETSYPADINSSLTDQDNQIIKKHRLSYRDIEDDFILQMRCENKPTLLIDRQKIQGERNLYMWLNQIFTSKEIDILKHIMSDKNINKTDNEYYSRKTRKKLQSIIGLYDFSMAVSTVSPKIKKHIEEDKKNEKRN